MYKELQEYMDELTTDEGMREYMAMFEDDEPSVSVYCVSYIVMCMCLYRTHGWAWMRMGCQVTLTQYIHS